MEIIEAGKIDLEEITNDLDYAELAFLVDKDSFLKRIKIARRELGLKRLFKYKKDVGWYDRKGDTSLSMKEFLPMADNITHSIEREFKRGVNFHEAILAAILTCKITDLDFKFSTFCDIYPFKNKSTENFFSKNFPMVGIFVNPETKWEDIKYLWDIEIPYLFKDINTRRKRQRGNKEIRTVRDWYWREKELKMQALYKEVNPKKTGAPTYRAIERALGRYRKLLQDK